MTVVMDMNQLLLIIILAALLAIMYVLRVLVIMEREMSNIEMHMERIVKKLYKEEEEVVDEVEDVEKKLKH